MPHAHRAHSFGGLAIGKLEFAGAGNAARATKFRQAIGDFLRFAARRVCAPCALTAVEPTTHDDETLHVARGQPISRLSVAMATVVQSGMAATTNMPVTSTKLEGAAGSPLSMASIGLFRGKPRNAGVA